MLLRPLVAKRRPQNVFIWGPLFLIAQRRSPHVVGEASFACAAFCSDTYFFVCLRHIRNMFPRCGLGSTAQCLYKKPPRRLSGVLAVVSSSSALFSTYFVASLLRNTNAPHCLPCIVPQERRRATSRNNSKYKPSTKSLRHLYCSCV